MDCIIYLVTYVGQKESSYTWVSHHYSSAVTLMESLEYEFPDREWRICEKDVS